MEDDGHCKHFLQKKKRRCRMLHLQGQEYCAEHVIGKVNISPELIEGSKTAIVLERQPCPYDPKHTVSVSKLKEHMKKCNSRPPDKDYYLASANVSDKPNEDEELNILNMSQDEKIDLIMGLIEFHKARVPSIDNHFGIHELLLSDFVRSDVGESALRHSTQIGSIAKLCDDHGLLQDSTCFIEFGSGRGGLSFGLARVVKDKGLQNCKFILIDRTSPRYKRDNHFKNGTTGGEVVIERIKISIEDLLVDKLPGIADYKHIVGVTKHLCGAGTDVALRSLFEKTSNSENHKVRGMVFATCCHHRTEYKDLVGNECLTTQFSQGNFKALRQVAAWATNGDYTSSFIKERFLVAASKLKFFDDMGKTYQEITLKKTVGRLVKEIMDHCRVEYINNSSRGIQLSCKLVNYVDMSTTRENVAILAFSDNAT